MITELYTQSTLTLGEDIADSGGLETAFDAWQVRYTHDPLGTKHEKQV